MTEERREKTNGDEDVAGPRRMLNEKQVLEIVSVGRTTLYRMETGRFPRSTYISPNRRVWFADQIVAWQKAVDEFNPSRAAVAFGTKIKHFICSVGERQATMARDISDAILSHVSNFAVGLVIREVGKGSRVLGSGVLVSIEGRRGILTCGHVAEAYEKLPEIGLIRFVAGAQQRRILPLADTQTIILQSSDTFEENKEVLDLAFTLLPPEAAFSIEAHGVS